MTSRNSAPGAIQYLRSLLHDMSVNHYVAIQGGEYHVRFYNPSTSAFNSVRFLGETPNFSPHFEVVERAAGSTELQTKRFHTLRPLLEHLGLNDDMIAKQRIRFNASRNRSDQTPDAPKMTM